MRPILHHYPMSPFAEKVRTLLGFKRIEWSSVLIPSIMPKPDVIALTGGYRKTPILQLGADIYCDSALIATVLERLAPTPSFYPPQCAGLTSIVSRWADSTLFWTAIAYSLQPEGAAHRFKDMSPQAQKAFADDRAAFRSTVPRMRAAEAAQALKLYLGELEALLQDGRSWLLGSAASIADFSVYHCLWFVTHSGPLGSLLQQYSRVTNWLERMQLIGHGVFDTISSSDAVEVAARSTATPPSGETFLDTHRLALGSQVAVAAADYGTEPTVGELVISTQNELGVRRTDPRAGTVIVHFPRIGFEVRKVE